MFTKVSTTAAKVVRKGMFAKYVRRIGLAYVYSDYVQCKMGYVYFIVIYNVKASMQYLQKYMADNYWLITSIQVLPLPNSQV